MAPAPSAFAVHGSTQPGGLPMTKIMTFAAAAASLIAGIGAVATAQVVNQRPSQQKIDFAKGTANLLQNEMIAALLTEFNETTTANAEQGKIAISLIFDN